MLLTENTAAGARAKLRHYGLWEFFLAGGAFSRPGSHRERTRTDAVGALRYDLAALEVSGPWLALESLPGSSRLASVLCLEAR